MTQKKFAFSGVIETYLIPITGFYSIEAWGGAGGGTIKPKGAYSLSYSRLNQSQKIFVLVGEAAGTGNISSDYSHGCGGGGGGTFIATGETVNTSNPLCVAGGGGSQLCTDIISDYSHGQSTQIGGDMGNRKQNVGYGGLSQYGCGGGGFYGDGENGNYRLVRPGISFRNGGSRIPGVGFQTAYGGFGGGAANHGGCGQNVGGGGYTGGSSFTSSCVNGGGGGSFHSGSYGFNHSYSRAGYESMPNPRISNSIIIGNNGNGFARITFLESKSFNLSAKFYNIKLIFMLLCFIVPC